MKKENVKLLMLIVLLLVVGGIVIFLPSEQSSQTVTTVVENVDEAETEQDDKIANSMIINVDDDAPEFSVEMTNGETLSLESLRGKVVLVNFWATWCPPCREELKRVEKDLIEHFAGRDFVFIPISRGEEKATVEAFLKKNGYTFPVGLDTDQSIFKSYAKEYIPRNFLINRHGVVIEATIGYEPEEFDQLLQKIEMSLNAR
ncbi:MAG: TlpA disulfide reductase family protein [Rikenellaceae bacterium]